MAKKSATDKATDKPKVNTSAAVREYLTANKGAIGLPRVCWALG